jgi:tRNA splicing ligase
LASSLVFPVRAFKKENGFLAIVAWDKIKEDLFIASKTSVSGEHTRYIKAAMTPEQHSAIAEYLKNNDSMTLVFECIDPVNDPHIIKYDKVKLVLLDAIYNELTFNKVPYNELCALAGKLGVEVKECSYILKDWEAFRDLYNDTLAEDYQLNGEYIEGYVFEDTNGFMVKVKSGYYQLWKKLRSVADQTLRCGYITRTGMLTSALENYFYGFCRECFNVDRDPVTKSYQYNTDIISMRERFFASR